MTPRTDKLTASLLYLAVTMQRLLGTRSAAQGLVRYGVPLPVALRVLTRPGQRRV